MVFKLFLNGFLNGLFGSLIVGSRTSTTTVCCDAPHAKPGRRALCHAAGRLRSERAEPGRGGAATTRRTSLGPWRGRRMCYLSRDAGWPCAAALRLRRAVLSKVFWPGVREQLSRVRTGEVSYRVGLRGGGGVGMGVSGMVFVGLVLGCIEAKFCK